MQNKIILARLRVKNKLTYNDLAEILNVSLSSYKLYETGTIPMSLEELNVLSNYYNVSFDYLLGISSVSEREHFCPNVDYQYLRFYLRYLRKMARLNQKKLADELHFSLHTVSKFEKNGYNVNIEYLIKMAKKFQISSDYICGKSLKKEILKHKNRTS